jgi:hypothetical protein
MKWLIWVDAALGGLLIFNTAVIAHFLYEHSAEPYLYVMLFNTALLGWFAHQQWREYKPPNKPN